MTAETFRRFFLSFLAVTIMAGCAGRQAKVKPQPAPMTAAVVSALETAPTPELGSPTEVGQRPSTRSSAERRSASPVPDPIAKVALQAAEAQARDYRISPQDLLDISVFQEKDMDRTVRVDQTGTINFPLIGTVDLSGLNVRQAEEKLKNLLTAFVIDPQVSVFIKEYHQKKIFILGEVQKPGAYDFPTEKGMTVLEAISLSGGFTKVAAPDKTRVIRSVEGQSKDIVVPVSAITAGGDKTKDMPLEPNDILYIPQSFF